MVERAKSHGEALRQETARIVAFVAEGLAQVSATCSGVVLQRNRGAEAITLSVSVAGLAHAAQLGLIRRDGAAIFSAADQTKAGTDPDQDTCGSAPRMVAESPVGKPLTC
ncbi:MAG: hypothetical protein HC779_05160 [Phyllobacteriaceae bacterium]|nr:hypothetical protein [Phyllobacteriaceae bacterium]